MMRTAISFVAALALFATLGGGEATQTEVLGVVTADGNVAASADLDEGNRDVVPADDQPFTITVDNLESPLLGPEIDWVRIIVPRARGFELNAAALDLEADGFGDWDVHVTRTDRSHSLTFSGDAISGGQSEEFDFPVDVLRPQNRDVPGPFQVMVSTDGGETADSAEGELTSLVRILEIVQGTVVAPELAADGSATAGQSVEYGMTVVNHALEAVEVEATLDEMGDGYTVDSQAAPGDIPAGGDTTFVADVTFDHFDDADERLRDFDVEADKTDTTAQARPQEFTYLVQAPPRLRLDEDSFEPNFVQPREADPEDPRDYRFSAEFTKERVPALTVESGTLEFADTVVDIDPAPSQTEWNGTVGELVTERTVVDGDDGDYDVTYTLEVVDGNGFAFTLHVDSEDELVSIDGIAPEIRDLDIDFPEDEDGDQQIRVKDGDRVAITGEVVDANPDPDGIFVTIAIDGFADIGPDQMELSTSDTAEGMEFEAVFEGEFGVPSQADFVVEVEAIDLAENTGDATLEDNPFADIPLQIDNIPPEVRDRGFIVERDDLDGVTGSERVIEFRFRENFLVKGGCNPLLYAIDGELLTHSVFYSDGSPCEQGEAGPDNVRILRMFDEKPRDWEGNVRYRPEHTAGDHRDRAKDGAGHFSDEGVQAVINRIAPPLPEILEVTRNDGEETAVFDDDRYWTRIDGRDLELTITGDGVRPGDRLEVWRAGERVDRSAAASENNEQLSAFLELPTGAADGTYTFRIRLVTPEVSGDFKDVDVELDTVAPVIGSIDVPDPDGDEITVSFVRADDPDTEEVLWRGSNFAGDWRAYEWDEFSEDHAEIGVRHVSGEGSTRTLEVNRQGWGDISGVEYLFQSNDRYEDRAGNTLADQFFDAS